ncbi:MAG: hypothetical protein AB7O26_04850 [Planctomycetaceae bacterium]
MKTDTQYIAARRGKFGAKAVAAAVIGLCSCTALPVVMAADLFPFGRATAQEPTDRQALPAGTVKAPPSKWQTEPSSPQTTTTTRRVVPIATAPSATRSGVKQVGYRQIAKPVPPSAPGATFTPSVPRDDIGVNPAVHNLKYSNRGPQPRDYVPEYADEYLLDGGDRALPLHREQVGYSGLETEDTVADFADHAGRRHVLPTNTVAIYSPRFAAVRTVSGSESGVTVDKLAHAGDTTRSVGMRTRTVPSYHSQRESTDGVRVRTRASGLGSPSIVEGVDQTTYASENVELLNVSQDLQFVKGGELLAGEKARLALGVQNAVIWNRDQFPIATASVDALHQVTARFKPQELVGVEDRSTPGQLRIVKLADKNVASIGDIVTFTIRYDNMGDKELKELQIIDNLTPRLVYVKDSATSDHDGRLDVTPNGEGSNILTFTLAGPLPGHEGGVLTFQAEIK